MSSNTHYTYAADDSAMIKVIQDPDVVRLKICPRNVPFGPDPTNLDEDIVLYDELEGAREISLDRAGVQRMIRDLREFRNRVFGADE